MSRSQCLAVKSSTKGSPHNLTYLDPNDINGSIQEHIRRRRYFTRYFRFEMIGSGGQANIFLSGHLQTREMVIEKTLDRRDLDEGHLEMLEMLCGDVAVNHNLLGILQLPTISDPIAVMEYCNGGDLHDFISQYAANNGPGHIPERFIKYVLLSLTKAVFFMHTGGGADGWHPILHRDIKPSNVLLKQNPEDPDGFPIVKLCDFDLAGFYDPSERFNGGTPAYWPPEQLAAGRFYARATPAGDVWAIGQVILEMTRFQGVRQPVTEPEAGEEDEEAERVCSGKRVEEPRAQGSSSRQRRKPVQQAQERFNYSEGLEVAMFAMLQPNPSKRAPIHVLANIVTDPGFFVGVDLDVPAQEESINFRYSAPRADWEWPVDNPGWQHDLYRETTPPVGHIRW